MVDFRYHLVSLVAVFLALAVGIVLGAGPLQNSIGTALSDQVDSLRTSRDEARRELDLAQRELESLNDGLDELRDPLVGNILEGETVAIVVLPGAHDDDVDSHVSALTSAGATVTGRVVVTEDFMDFDNASYRQALAGQITDYVEDVPEEDGYDVLAAAIDQVARQSGGSSQTATLTELLQDQSNPMIQSVDVSDEADVVLIVGPRSEVIDVEEEGDHEAHLTQLTSLVETMGERGPTVLVGSATESTDLVAHIRANSESETSTIDSVSEKYSTINSPLAVDQELSGSTVSWGVHDGATAIFGQPGEVTIAEDSDLDGEPTDGEVEDDAA